MCGYIKFQYFFFFQSKFHWLGRGKKRGGGGELRWMYYYPFFMVLQSGLQRSDVTVGHEEKLAVSDEELYLFVGYGTEILYPCFIMTLLYYMLVRHFNIPRSILWKTRNLVY